MIIKADEGPIYPVDRNYIILKYGEIIRTIFEYQQGYSNHTYYDNTISEEIAKEIDECDIDLGPLVRKMKRIHRTLVETK